MLNCLRTSIFKNTKMQRKNTNSTTAQRSKWPRIITLTLVVVILFVAVSLLPRGFSGDTSVIGQGTNALVLIHDDNLLQSGETMVVMNKIRDEYVDRLEFIVADINTPDGRTFANTHNLMPPALVFFSGNGQRLKTLYEGQTVESLQRELSTNFGY